MVVVEDEAAVHIARRQLGERVDCRIVLVEQRDRITRNHRVAHTAGIPLVARHRGDRAEGEEPDRRPVLKHRIGRIGDGSELVQ